jgi:hypothetical protein
MSQDKKTIAEI